MCVVLCHSFCLLLVFLDRIIIILTVIFIKSETSSFRTLTHIFFKKPLLGKTTRGVKKEHFTGEKEHFRGEKEHFGGEAKSAKPHGKRLF